MDPGQIFWLFFMLAALQPAMSQRFLEASRKRLIGQIERNRRSRVVLLVHRQETMSVLGFAASRCSRVVLGATLQKRWPTSV